MAIIREVSIKVYTGCESESEISKNPDITADILVQFHSLDGSSSLSHSAVRSVYSVDTHY